MSFFLKLNLQFFSEETHPFAEAATPTEPHPFAADPSESSFAQFTDNPNPLTVDYQPPNTPQLQSQNDQGQVAPQSAEEQVEELDFGGRKVKVVDPIIHDLHKDYSHLTRTYQQTNQELTSALELANQWKQYAEQQTQQPQVAETPQQTTSSGISAERQQQLNDEYMERMYENKFAADEWWNSQPEIVAANEERFRAALNERLAPIEQEKQALQAQQAADQFLQSHTDFEDYRDAMQNILNEKPYIQEYPDALEVLYSMAKTQQAQQVPTFEAMLDDPKNQQAILKNEKIRGMVFQDYQQNKTQANQQLPTLMGNPVGSQTPMSAGERAPRNLSEATRYWLNSQGQPN